MNTQNQSVTVGQTNTSAVTTQGENGQNQTTTTTTTGGATVGQNTLGGNYSTSTTDRQRQHQWLGGERQHQTQTGTVTGGGSVTADGTTVGGNVTVGENQLGASASLKRGQFAISGGFNVTAGEVKTDDHSGDLTASMLGGGYTVSTVQRNQVDLSASASFRGIGVSGAMSSGNTVEALAQPACCPRAGTRCRRKKRPTSDPAGSPLGHPIRTGSASRNF